MAMASMPIHNETDYLLTDTICQHIIRDAQEHFGERIRSIRVQYGIARHAFNARTQEVRYAFSPTDFGLVPTISLPETATSPVSFPARNDALEEEDVFTLDDPIEDADEDEEDSALDNEDEEE
jgi:hypothetical protein